MSIAPPRTSIATIRMPNAPRPCRVATCAKRFSARVERECRQALAQFGLPLDLYSCVIERGSTGEGPYYEGGGIQWHEDETVTATFTHRETGAEVVVTEIWADRRTGKVYQFGTQYGALTL